MLRRCLGELCAAQGGTAAAAAAGALRGPPGVAAVAAAAAAAGAGSRPAAAAAALAYSRPYSGNAREALSDAAQRIRAAAATSADAVKAASSTVAKAPLALYKALPTSAQQLVDAAQTPGAVNRVISLQLTAFWQHHSNTIIAATAAGACYASWRALLRTTQVFVDMSDASLATSAGLLGLAGSGVAFGYLALRRRYTIDPAAVYRQAMYRLNTHPGLLEVMGAPLVGSPVQASVLTGGSIHFRGLRPKLQSKRIQMIFPLKGAERRGLVSLEAKKRHGHLRFKLLAVDVPSVAGGEQRIYLEGGPSLYERGGVLGVLRDPFIRALSMEEAFMAEDEAEDAAEEQQRAAAAAQRAAEAAAKQPKPLDEGGGLYFYEKVLLGARQAWARWAKQGEKGAAPLAATAPPPKQQPSLGLGKQQQQAEAGAVARAA